MKTFLRRDLHKEKEKNIPPMSHRPHFLSSLVLPFDVYKGSSDYKGKVMCGIINPGRRRRKRLQSLKDEGPAGTLLRGNGKGLLGALHRSALSPPHRSSPPGIRHWLSLLLYLEHRYKVNTWWIKEFHGIVTGFLNGWAHQSLGFCFFFSAFTKAFTALGLWGPFQDKYPTVAQEPHRPLPNWNCLCSCW